MRRMVGFALAMVPSLLLLLGTYLWLRSVDYDGSRCATEHGVCIDTTDGWRADAPSGTTSTTD